MPVKSFFNFPSFFSIYGLQKALREKSHKLLDSSKLQTALKKCIIYDKEPKCFGLLVA
tara:strand:- start:612 stop:785 length:174 start_codon:yes stop_codon:yes gene_type:complete